MEQIPKSQSPGENSSREPLTPQTPLLQQLRTEALLFQAMVAGLAAIEGALERKAS